MKKEIKSKSAQKRIKALKKAKKQARVKEFVYEDIKEPVEIMSIVTPNNWEEIFDSCLVTKRSCGHSEFVFPPAMVKEFIKRLLFLGACDELSRALGKALDGMDEVDK